MIVVKNKFISPQAALRGQHLNKAAKKGEENQDAFCRESGRMRFSFAPFINHGADSEAENYR